MMESKGESRDSPAFRLARVNITGMTFCKGGGIVAAPAGRDSPWNPIRPGRHMRLKTRVWQRIIRQPVMLSVSGPFWLMVAPASLPL